MPGHQPAAERGQPRDGLAGAQAREQRMRVRFEFRQPSPPRRPGTVSPAYRGARATLTDGSDGPSRRFAVCVIEPDGQPVASRGASSGGYFEMPIL